MRYLFADSSAFPLSHNFLETLAVGIDTAVALLEVDEALDRSRRTIEEANTTALTELADIDRYAERAAWAFGEREGLSNVTARVVADLAGLAARELERARANVRSWREATVRRAEQCMSPAEQLRPFDRFLARYELPMTTWGLRWRAGHGDEPVQAQAYAVMQRGLSATLAVDIPKKHLWAEPVRVGDLEKRVCIRLVGRNVFGREAMRDEQLDRYFVSRVTHTTEREAFILSKRAKESSPGLRVSMREGVDQRVLVVRIDENEVPAGEPVVLDGVDAVMLKRLWTRIQETILDLVFCRAHLVSAALHGKPLAESESPAAVAAILVHSLAPLARQVDKHGRSSDELQLKRDLGNGRREELFVAKKDLVARYAGLPPHAREIFAALGLEEPRRSRPAASRPSASRPRSDEAYPTSDVYPATRPPAQPVSSLPPAPPAYDLPAPSIPPRRPNLRVVA